MAAANGRGGCTGARNELLRCGVTGQQYINAPTYNRRFVHTITFTGTRSCDTIQSNARRNNSPCRLIEHAEPTSLRPVRHT